MPRVTDKEPLPPATAACDVKAHFDCDGTGRMCDVCGESEAACRCGEQKLEKCKDCDGTGLLCVTHESPAGLKGGPCDVVKKAAKS